MTNTDDNVAEDPSIWETNTLMMDEHDMGMAYSTPLSEL
jgi:hypothetical protein